MEGSDNDGDAASFDGEDRESEEEADMLGRRRTYEHSPERSEKSSWSGRSRSSGCEGIDASLEDQTGTSQTSLRSSSKRSLTRERSMSGYHPHLQHSGSRRYDGNGEEDFDFDQISEGESQRGQGLSSEEGMTEDENGEETVIETSCDEASFNTSVYSYKETGSSSELSIDPVVWKKFKFLSSILKVGYVECFYLFIFVINYLLFISLV